MPAPRRPRLRTPLPRDLARPNCAMIEDEMTVRITEAELARDIHALLEKVQARVEIIVE